MPEMRTTPAPARAPNEVNDAGQKKSVAKRRLGRGGRERPLPVNRAASRRSPARSTERRLKHRASIRPFAYVRLRPRRVRSCPASVRPSVRLSLRPSASAPCFSESGGKYRATEGNRDGSSEGRRWKERKRRQSEQSDGDGDGGASQQVRRRPSCGNESLCPHVIRVLSFSHGCPRGRR